MKISIIHKLSFSSIFLMLFSAAVVGGVFYIKTTTVLVEHALDDITIKINNAGNRLKVRIDTQREDTLFLASTPPIQGVLRSLNEEQYDIEGGSSYLQWKKRLESIFATMLGSKSGYLKIRFIDNAGQEIVVVGNENGKIVSSSRDQLQNKAHRSYVRETLKLSVGKVYLSEVNLNREYGKVSEPHQEVLRSATIIRDEWTQKVAGLLLLTAEIGHELREIQREITIQDINLNTASNRIYITNDHGGYLLHPDGTKTYGFDLGKRFRVQEDIPRLARLFLPDNKDQNIVLQPKEFDNLHVANFTKINFDPYRPERFITVGITQLYSEIVKKQSGVLNDAFILALLLAIPILMLAIYYSYRLAQPIKQITQVMDDYTNQRETTVAMPVNQKDEIGLLAKSFENMIGQVEEAQLNLKEMNYSLESKVAERTQALEVSETRQRSIVENIVDGLITMDENGMVASFNPAAENIFGYQAEDVIGNNIKMLMPDPFHSEHDGYLNNYHQTRNKKIIGIGREVEGQRKDGSVFPLDLAVGEMLIEGKKMFTGVVRDITERKQMDKMKNEFISTVSHELRTPLTSIRGSLGLISGGAVGELPEQAREMLKIAGNNTERLLILINDILDIQKIESGQMAFSFESLDITSFLEQAIAENAAYGDQHDVKFVIANALPNARVFADKDRMMQVMANLMSNAAKFSPDGEVVEISVAQRHGGQIRISVTDHGMGIPEVFQPKLFDKFTQSDSSDTRQKGGTGLGLSITKVIVEKHGGTIGFISKKGEGTSFYVDLPELMEEITANDNVIPRKVQGERQASVLIVEDDADVAVLLKRILVEAGYSSDIAYNTDEARELLHNNPGQYKAITLDITLPGKSGRSFFEDLRKETSTHDIPVVVVSVQADEAKQELNGGAIGVVDWLSKPIDSQRLLAAVQQAAGSINLPRVLHVEDEPDVHKVVSTLLRNYCSLTWAATFAASKKMLETEEFELVLLDIGLPDGSGLDLLETIEKYVKPPRVVIFSAYDVTQEYADKVSAVLVKSKTNNSKLAEIISSVIKQTMEI